MHVKELRPIDEGPEVEEGRKIMLRMEFGPVFWSGCCRYEKVQEADHDVGALRIGCVEERKNLVEHCGDLERIEVELREGAQFGEGADIAFRRHIAELSYLGWQHEHLQLFEERAPVKGDLFAWFKIMLPSIRIRVSYVLSMRKEVNREVLLAQKTLVDT